MLLTSLVSTHPHNTHTHTHTHTYALLYPKGAGDRISRRLSYSLVDGFVGHLRIEIQVDFLKLNVYYIYLK